MSGALATELEIVRAQRDTLLSAAEDLLVSLDHMIGGTHAAAKLRKAIAESKEQAA